MNDFHLSIDQRFRSFLQSSRQFDWRAGNFWLYFSGWVLAFFLAFFPGADYFPGPVLFVGFIFLWFVLVEQIGERIKPPPELLLAMLGILLILEYLLITVFASSTLAGGAQIDAGTFGNFLQTLILSLFVLAFSVLIVQHKQTNRGILIVLALIALPVESLIESNSEYFIIFFELILFFLLLNRTSWLEQLSKAECWIYLGVFILLFQLALWLDPFPAVDAKTFQESTLWFSFPKFLYILLLCYLLALIVKIPGVLIFNHASLSRKLWISSLFQSTFPQIFQLIALLLIFYIFISIWQAQNIRNALQYQLENVQQDSVIVPFDYYVFSTNDHKFSITWEGYHYEDVSGLPKKGVLQLRRDSQSPDDSLNSDFFLFTRVDSAGVGDFIYLIKIDAPFLRETLAAKMNFLGGSSLLNYSVAPDQWLLHTEKIHLWESDKNVRIFPFSFVDYRRVHPLRVALENPTDEFENTNVTLGFLKKWPLTFGRVFVPIWNAPAKKSYLAFDVVLDIRPSFRWSDLLTLVLVAMFLYMLLNMFIIRRMISFGSQINKIIVQKFNQLKNGIQQISSGNFDYKIHFEGDDEFVELAESFNRMGERLHETMAERREKDRLQFELQSARDVQTSLLPHTLPGVPGYEIAASLHTATEVGGDFYDIFSADTSGKSGRFLFTVGDVSGKGSSAALYMAQCMSLTRYSRQFTDNPKRICQRLNAYFASEVEDRRVFVTMIVGLLDARKKRLSFVRAGHTEPIFIPGDPEKPLRFLSASGLGIGLTNREDLFEKTLQTVEVDFKPGDALVFYTDGMIEASRPAAAGGEKETFDEAQLMRHLQQIRGKSAAAIKSDISAVIDAFYADHPRVDDHTLFVIRRNK